ncbi:hypothetical protein ATANTOWER_020806 [Ataeniobius toweri]|uniref:Uncharacterized protein n=1 Tax=Ataeniobius toweri TaxID=208326 RepID=A0ABU7A2H8_9TELE|nr:hypothetical protein [Ataeniobius toweri]
MTPSCVSAPTNQRQVCIPPQPITLQGFAFKDLQPWISLLSHRASILRPSINEIVLPVTRVPPPHHPPVSGSSFSSGRSSGTPGFHVFFYSGCPSILPASFIPFMDSLQRSISSIIQISLSSSPTLPLQHFLFSALPKLNPLLGSAHCHSPSQRLSWLVSKGSLTSIHSAFSCLRGTIHSSSSTPSWLDLSFSCLCCLIFLSTFAAELHSLSTFGTLSFIY